MNLENTPAINRVTPMFEVGDYSHESPIVREILTRSLDNLGVSPQTTRLGRQADALDVAENHHAIVEALESYSIQFAALFNGGSPDHYTIDKYCVGLAEHARSLEAISVIESEPFYFELARIVREESSWWREHCNRWMY